MPSSSKANNHLTKHAFSGRQQNKEKTKKNSNKKLGQRYIIRDPHHGLKKKKKSFTSW